MGNVLLEDWEETFIIPGIALFFQNPPTAEAVARLRRLIDDIEQANELRPLVRLHKD